MIEQPADLSRSGPDVAAAVDRAAEGTPHGGVESDPTGATPHRAPVEQVKGDPGITGGQVVDGPGERDDDLPQTRATGSGGAQAQQGARASDEVAGG